MGLLHKVLQRIRHAFQARRPALMHSPYLYELLPAIHDEESHYYAFDQIESMRDALQEDERPIPLLDLGAGSHVLSADAPSAVKDICRAAASPAGRCRMIYRLLEREKPRLVLELGTSLGVMTCYLAAAATSGEVHTIEGNPAIAEIAKENAQRLNLKNIHFHTGAFADVLPNLLGKISPIDFVLIDGDHRGHALLEYLALIRPFLSPSAIVMIDDIRWSQDMYRAWQSIEADKSIPCCLDYFRFGLLFYRKEFLEPVRERIRVSGV